MILNKKAIIISDVNSWKFNVRIFWYFRSEQIHNLNQHQNLAERIDNE